MQNEDISNKTISIYARSASKVLRFFAKHGYNGFKMIHNKRKQNKDIRKSQKQQTYKKLCRSGQGLSAVELETEKDDISVFSKIAKEYRLGFAVKRDNETGLYTMYFKAKDKEVYDKVFARYANTLEKIGRAKAAHKSLTAQLSEKKAEAERINKERTQNKVKKIFKEDENTK